MHQFILALLPGAGVMLYLFGVGVLINIIIAILTALLCEYIVLRMRALPSRTLLDGSAVATALLLALALPPLLPVWMVIIGSAFAILLAKHAYGGLGHNLFNPAMVGFAVLIISFPMAMSTWAPPNTDVNLAQVLEIKSGAPLPDATSGATPLDEFKFRGALTNDEYWDDNRTNNWHAWVVINAIFLISGLYLLYRGICKWHAPVAMLGVLAFLSLIFYDGGSSAGLGSPLFQLFSGATMLGAFFILTDPVTSPDSIRGQFMFGAGVGILIFTIRSVGAYPEGLAFAVLFMNGATPLINYLEFHR